MIWASRSRGSVRRISSWQTTISRARFWRRNGGRLAQPVSLILLTDLELRVQPRPSTDGNAVASVLEQIKGRISSLTPAMGGEGALQRFQLSARQMGNIA